MSDDPVVGEEGAVEEDPVEEVEEEDSVEGGEETTEEEGEGETEGEEPEVEVEEEEEPETANYKDAFKKHPELRKAFFEHNQYTSVFPTPDDAREAYEKVQTLDDFETAIQQGDVNPVINAIIESNPGAFNQLAESFLPNIQQMDQRLYDRVLAPEVAKLLKAAQIAGNKNQNKSLFLAAQHLSHWLFNTENPPSFQPTAPPAPQDNRAGIQQRSQEFFKELDDEIAGFLNTEASRALDPNNVIPSSLKRATVSDIIAESVKILRSDTAAQGALKVLRDKAIRSGFSYDSRKTLRDAYMTKMKPIIARLKGAKREEAMKSLGKSVGQNGKGKKVLPSGSTASGAKRPVDPKKIDVSRTSMRDALDGNFVLKGQK